MIFFLLSAKAVNEKTTSSLHTGRDMDVCLLDQKNITKCFGLEVLHVSRKLHCFFLFFIFACFLIRLIGLLFRDVAVFQISAVCKKSE